MSHDHARAVADAVLFEGYALYPYRLSAIKNRQRWPFGVLAPRDFEEIGGGEASWLQAECVLEAEGEEARIDLRVRFLRLRRRRVEAPGPTGGFHDVDSVDVDGTRLASWDEGEVQEIEHSFSIRRARQDRVVPFGRPGDVEIDHVRSRRGDVVARVTRERRTIAGLLHVHVEPIVAAHPCVCVRLRVENVTPWVGAPDARDDALGTFFVGTHVLLGATGAEFLSMIDPPAWAFGIVKACRNVRAFPVLAGPTGHRDLALASPIILGDYPKVSTEMPRGPFDATVVDELLTLRTLAMTDGEKREARALDGRVAGLIDRADHLPDGALARHGAIHEMGWKNAVANVPGGLGVTAGAHVRLKPGQRRTDAQDAFLEGRLATVRAVLRDAEDLAYVAVTIDDDPEAELHVLERRFHYFYAEEILPA